MNIIIGFCVLPWIIAILFTIFRKKSESELEYEHLTFKSDLNVRVKYVGGNEEKLEQGTYNDIIISEKCLGIARYNNIVKTINWDKVGICKNINVATERGVSFSRFVTLGVFSLIGSKNTKITNLVEINYYEDYMQKTLFLDYNEKTNEMIKLININKMKVQKSN